MIKKMMRNVLFVGLFLPISYLCAKNEQKGQAIHDFIAAEFKDNKQEVGQEKTEVKENVLKRKIWEKLTPKKAREASKTKRKYLSDYEKAQIIAKLLDAENQITLNYDVMRDLELVSGQSGQSLFSVLNGLADLQTTTGKITFAKNILNPIVDINMLKNRQDITKTLMHDKNLFNSIENNIKSFKNVENLVYEFFSENPMISDVEKKLVYSRFNVINNSPFLYNLATAIPATLTTFAVPIVFFGVSVSIYRFMNKFTKPFIDAMTEVEVKENQKKQIQENESPKTKEEIRKEIIEKNYPLVSDEELKKLDKSAARDALGINLFNNFCRKSAAGEDISWYDCAVLDKDLIKLTSPKMLFISQGIPTVYLGARQLSELSIIAQKAKEIQTYIAGVARIVEIAESLYRTLSTNAVLKQSTFGLLLAEFINNPELDWLKSLLSKSTFKGNPSVFSNWGRIFATLQEMEKQKDHFIPLLKALGEIDMYVGITNIMNQYATNDTNKVGFCFADFVENKGTPVIKAVEFWNPFILSHKKFEDIITNSIEFGENAQHAIVTGPNTCGKTTIIIALMLNAILAQVFGIAAGKQFALTPFGIFNATLTIGTDGAIGDSKFKAEIRQAQYVLGTVKAAEADHKLCLTIQDEIFTGTQDGAPAAADFLQKLGKYANNITLLATHFQKLTTLGAPYVNFKINAAVEGKTVKRYYTISRGISDLNIAHLLVEQAGLS